MEARHGRVRIERDLRVVVRVHVLPLDLPAVLLEDPRHRDVEAGLGDLRHAPRAVVDDPERPLRVGEAGLLGPRGERVDGQRQVAPLMRPPAD